MPQKCTTRMSRHYYVQRERARHVVHHRIECRPVKRTDSERRVHAGVMREPSNCGKSTTVHRCRAVVARCSSGGTGASHAVERCRVLKAVRIREGMLPRSYVGEGVGAVKKRESRKRGGARNRVNRCRVRCVPSSSSVARVCASQYNLCNSYERNRRRGASRYRTDVECSATLLGSMRWG